MVVLAMAGMAVAANPGAFDFGPGVSEPVGILPGQSATIIISSQGSGSIAGCEINLRLDDPFQMMSLELIAGTVFQSNNTGQTVSLFTDPLAPDSYADYVQSSITTASGMVNVDPGSVVALLTISVPNNPGLVGRTGSLISFDPDDSFTLPCNWGDGAGVPQDSLQLKVLPEPASALLLLAAMPLIRRRRA